MMLTITIVTKTMMTMTTMMTTSILCAPPGYQACHRTQVETPIGCHYLHAQSVHFTFVSNFWKAFWQTFCVNKYSLVCQFFQNNSYIGNWNSFKWSEKICTCNRWIIQTPLSSTLMRLRLLQLPSQIELEFAINKHWLWSQKCKNLDEIASSHYHHDYRHHHHDLRTWSASIIAKSRHGFASNPPPVKLLPTRYRLVEAFVPQQCFVLLPRL